MSTKNEDDLQNLGRAVPFKTEKAWLEGQIRVFEQVQKILKYDLDLLNGK